MCIRDSNRLAHIQSQPTINTTIKHADGGAKIIHQIDQKEIANSSTVSIHQGRLLSINIQRAAKEIKKAGVKAKHMAVKSIVSAFQSATKNLRVDQKGLALRHALQHKDLKPLSISCGLIGDQSVKNKLFQNITVLLKTARKTEKRHGRTTDDLRSVVHSIVLATLPPPGEREVCSIIDQTNRTITITTQQCTLLP